MEHDFIKRSEVTSAYKIILQGSADEAAFGRVFNPALKHTHVLDFHEEVHQDGEVKRKAIVVEMRPLDLIEVRARSNDFERLSEVELRTLIDRHKIELPKLDRGQSLPEQRGSMIKALRDHKPAPSAQDAAGATKGALVIPAEVLALDWPNAQTQAAMLGVNMNGVPKDGTRGLPILHQRIAKKMIEKEAVPT